MHERTSTAAGPGGVAAGRVTGTGRLARHGALYAVGVVVQGVSTLAALPFATRVLGPAEYGQVAVGLSIIQIGAVFAVAGLPVAITRAYFDEGDGPRRARAMLGLVVGTGLVCTAAALLLAPLVGAVVSWALAAVGVMTFVVGAQAILRAQDRPFVFIATAIGYTAGAHLVGLLAVLVGPSSAETYLAGYFAGAALTGLVALLLTSPCPPWRVRGAFRESLAIALPVVPHTAALLVLNSADPLILSALLGSADAGRYQVAMMLGLAPLAILSGINNAWAPAVMRTADRDDWSFVVRTMRPMLWLATACVLGLALVAPLAVQVLAPPEFGHETLTRLSQLIALCALPHVVYLGSSTVIFTQKRTTPLALSSPLTAIAFLAVSVPAVLTGGLIGMAVAKVAAFALLAVATLQATRRVARVRWLFPRWSPMVLAGVGGVLALLVVPRTAATTWSQAAAAVLLGAVVLVVLLRTGGSLGEPAAPRPGGSDPA